MKDFQVWVYGHKVPTLKVKVVAPNCTIYILALNGHQQIEYKTITNFQLQPMRVEEFLYSTIKKFKNFWVSRMSVFENL